jgi:hypothetical protein
MNTQSMGLAAITVASPGIGVMPIAGGSTDNKNTTDSSSREVGGWKLGLAMFRLDYLSCFLTISATVHVGRKS